MVRLATTIPTRLDAQASTVLWLYWQEPRPLKRLCYLHPLSPRKTQSSFTTLIAYFDINERSGRCEPVSLIQNSQGSAERHFFNAFREGNLVLKWPANSGLSYALIRSNLD